MTHFPSDPGDQERQKGKRRRSTLKTPEPPSLWDISDRPPPTPFQIKSPTSRDAAAEIREETKAKRRDLVHKLVRGSPKGLARFQIATAMGVQDHVVSSSVDALIKMRKIEEAKDRTVVNPASGKACAVLVLIKHVSDEEAA